MDTQVSKFEPKGLVAEVSAGFVGREEEARVAVLALLTKSHAVFVGEPGTAKSALLRRLAALINARFFYYLLSKYTIPDELVGPIDPIAYKAGQYKRLTKGRITEAEIAFIDEIWKGSSETLNALLTISNERIFTDADGTVYQVPLWSLYGASNELPSDSELQAFYDRFLLRHFVRRIESGILEQAIIHNLTGSSQVKPICSLKGIQQVYDSITAYMTQNSHAIAKTVTQLVVVLRQHGIFVSDRTATSPNHLPRLVATYSQVFNADLRKAAIAVSKYVLPSEEAFEAYRKALDELIPPELREAGDKLNEARELASAGRLPEAKRLAAEAIQTAQNLFAKPERVELYRDEVKEIIQQAERLVTEITRIEQRLKEFKKG